MDNTGVGGVQIDLFLGKGFTDGALMGHSPSESSCRVSVLHFLRGHFLRGLFVWLVCGRGKSRRVGALSNHRIEGSND